MVHFTQLHRLTDTHHFGGVQGGVLGDQDIHRRQAGLGCRNLDHHVGVHLTVDPGFLNDHPGIVFVDRVALYAHIAVSPPAFFPQRHEALRDLLHEFALQNGLGRVAVVGFLENSGQKLACMRTFGLMRQHLPGVGRVLRTAHRTTGYTQIRLRPGNVVNPEFGRRECFDTLKIVLVHRFSCFIVQLIEPSRRLCPLCAQPWGA